MESIVSGKVDWPLLCVTQKSWWQYMYVRECAGQTGMVCPGH